MAARTAQGLACFLWFFGMIVAILSVSLSVRLYWYLDGFCTYVPRCPTYSCIGCWCQMYYQCYNGDWFWARPISEDKLPPPKFSSVNITDVDGEGGDGEPDNWAAIVALSCGLVGSLLIMFGTCGPMTRRGAAPASTACLATSACILHFTTVVCLGIQYFTWERDQWVYNEFRSNGKFGNYFQHTGTLAEYYAEDKYYGAFGGIINAVMVFATILLFFEFVYAILVATAPPEKYWLHGVSEMTFRDHPGNPHGGENPATYQTA